ncbi:MAG: winged helix-turn-helix transcriptional regulator [Verrucomicrobia bacterium]|nr:winged helix-turn-helix transcriptional regulator [Verrucomicrobiota bacterium]MBT7068818.1 winged helix-turn-helix transcriptional regulator [Verrucomicrobiota bacterium]MBT7699874.1 winged helix-turn-helix transcriptional regulator [Verrucomicrobiota bacterium]
MRPITEQRSAIKQPLDSIMGSEGNVRLLRALIEVGTPLGASDAARLAGLTPAGARKALERLLDTGFVENVGSGRTLQYGLRRREPLIRAIELLFDKERDRYESFVSSLKGALTGFTEIRMAWFSGAPVESGQPVDMSVVADAKEIDWIGDELRSLLRGIEEEYDLIVEARVFTRADAPTPGSDAVFLICMEADIGARTNQPQSHTLKEERSLLMAREVARMMRSDPSLVARAKHHLNRLMHDEQGTATHAIAEWRQLLETYSPRQLRQLLVSTSSRATRLRQSSPFFAILSEEERDRLMSSLEKTQ